MYSGTLPAITNQQSWAPIFEIVDADTGDDIDLKDAEIVFELRDQRSKTTILSATTINGKIVVTDTGFFQVSFARSEMQTLYPGSFDFGCIVTLNGDTAEPMVGTISVLDGIVSQ